MENLKKYGIYIAIGLLITALIFATVFGYLWGTQRAENKTLREEKKEYLRIKREQDSIVKVTLKRVDFVIDSMNRLHNEGVEVDKTTESSRRFVDNDKKKEREEISNIPSLSVGEQLKLFSRNGNEYKPQ